MRRSLLGFFAPLVFIALIGGCSTAYRTTEVERTRTFYVARPTTFADAMAAASRAVGAWSVLDANREALVHGGRPEDADAYRAERVKEDELPFNDAGDATTHTDVVPSKGGAIEPLPSGTRVSTRVAARVVKLGRAYEAFAVQLRVVSVYDGAAQTYPQLLADAAWRSLTSDVEKELQRVGFVEKLTKE